MSWRKQYDNMTPCGCGINWLYIGKVQGRRLWIRHMVDVTQPEIVSEEDMKEFDSDCFASLKKRAKVKTL